MDLARKHLDLARKMARHSLTEARRSVMDLRASALEGQDLAAALEAGMRSGPRAPAWMSSGCERAKPPAARRNGATPAAHRPGGRDQRGETRRRQPVASICNGQARKLNLRVVDNGRGFEQDDVFSDVGGHFGLIGMRERAERLGGELQLASHPGEGTEVEVTVPLP